MKLTLSLLMVAGSIYALPDSFVKAIHQVETGGRLGAIVGDNGKAYGPLQIHRVCWRDSNVKGVYPDNCAGLSYSTRVMASYLRRHCPSAVDSSDFETMARVWNGGPNGARKMATLNYWNKVKKNLAK